MVISGYFINDYWWLLVAILLMGIVGYCKPLMVVSDYFINEYWRLFYWWLFFIILGYIQL
jgi:hypothetical protein